MIRHIVCWKFLDHADVVTFLRRVQSGKVIVDYELSGA